LILVNLFAPGGARRQGVNANRQFKSTRSRLPSCGVVRDLTKKARAWQSTRGENQ
jgi:hypothetical protein